MKFLSQVTDHDHAIALGNFDGVHLGHQQVIKTAKQKAYEIGCRSAVVTFSPHPVKVLSKGNFHEILSLEEKTSTIKRLGIDEVIVINFTEDFSKLPAETFINELCQRLKIRSITTGYNFRFGHNRHGNIETIDRAKRKYNFKFNAINQVLYNGSQISSSILRQVIKVGCVRLFSDFTGRHYTIDCTFQSEIDGYQLYRISNENLLLPPDGVYLAEIDENHSCIFLMGSQLAVKMLDQSNGSKATKIKLLTILGQESSIDKVWFDKVKVISYIRKAKFCLS